MVIEACTCEEAFGLAHSHEGRVVMVEHHGDRWSEWQPTGIIRLWVDWKAVSRALMKSWRWRSDFDVVPHNNGCPSQENG